VAGCYSFVHALYQEVIYQWVPAAQRVQLHQCVGARMERGYGPLAGDIAAELAMYFEQGRQTQRAVTYLQQAADNALRRYGNTEAIQHLTKGLTLLKTLPDTPERTQNELGLLLTLGPVLMAAKGYGAPEVEHTYAQALQLCQQAGDTPPLFPVAEQCLHVTLDVAHRQQAKSLELRAAISLGRLWQQQGKHNAAHQLLAEVYNWFTEGFDTTDLQEARVLLAALRSAENAKNCSSQPTCRTRPSC
jgi:predicted ATPase